MHFAEGYARHTKSVGNENCVTRSIATLLLLGLVHHIITPNDMTPLSSDSTLVAKYLILVLFYENRTCHLRSVMDGLSGYRGMMAIKELMLATFHFYIYRFLLEDLNEFL